MYLNYAGHCFASAHHVVKNDKKKQIKFMRISQKFILLLKRRLLTK